MNIVTLPERKKREAARRAEAVRDVVATLRRFVEASGHRGRFIVFGSAVQQKLRHDSDLDVMIDFPEESESAAWKVVEDACRETNMPVDILSTASTSEAFVRKILARPVEIIT